MTDITNLYLKELKNNHSTKEKSLELIISARSGDENAKNQLIEDYLLLVVKIARKYMNMGVPLDELIAEGNVGLITSIDKFDISVGAPFSSCAQFWIKQSIIRNCMHGRRIVRLPENISELIRTDRWNGINYRELSLDRPNEEGETMADDIPDTDHEDAFSNEETILMKRKVEKILSFLKGRDAEVVKACYGIGREKPLEVAEAAELFDLTTTRINQILRESLKAMRVAHESAPETKAKEVTILSAKYGTEDENVDVKDKVTDLYKRNDIIKASNRLNGDPCPGIVKTLVIEYMVEGEKRTKKFSEGSVVKF